MGGTSLATDRGLVDPRPPVLFLMGPTASGKTALAVALAQRLPFEIISVDSALVYRGMDIGTAKPDADTLRLVPHPPGGYSRSGRGVFRRPVSSDALPRSPPFRPRAVFRCWLAAPCCTFRALERGLAELPVADPAIRARLAEELAGRGGAALHGRLARCDPAAAARIHPHDAQRIQRALKYMN